MLFRIGKVLLLKPWDKKKVGNNIFVNSVVCAGIFKKYKTGIKIFSLYNETHR